MAAETAPLPFAGNNALALDRLPVEVSAVSQPPDQPPDDELPLWASEQKIIPFNEIPRPGGRSQFTPPPGVPPRPVVPPARPRPTQKARSSGPPPEQEKLQFHPPPPPRELTNGVLAANHCNREVASIPHRLSAALADGVMILTGFAVWFAVVQLVGMALDVPGMLGTGKILLTRMGMFLVLITAFYSVLWMFARRETAGMRMLGLELITFDDTPLDPPTRAARVAATWLSIGAGGLGLFWALADEEKLTWQDHITRTYPTFRETSESFVKQRGRTAY